MPYRSAAMELAFASVSVTGLDGELDLREVDALLEAVLRDGRVDGNERRLLTAMLGGVREESVAPAVWARVQEALRLCDLTETPEASRMSGHL